MSNASLLSRFDVKVPSIETGNPRPETPSFFRPAIDSHGGEDLFQPVVLADWMRSCPVVAPSHMCDDLLSMFRKKKELECVVVCEGQRKPVSLIMKNRFFQMVGSLYGLSLFGTKTIEPILGPPPLAAELDTDPQELIDRSLSRDESTFYDCVVLTERGRFAGILTVSDLLGLSRLIERKAVRRQVRTLRDTEAMIGDIYRAVANVTETANASRECSERISEMADQGRGELGGMLRLFRIWSDTASRQETAVRELTERTAAADEIIRLIAELADRCNLLAVNASIEAARAGAHGKGFAVVAGEIRTLADQTKASAGQINVMLKSMAESAETAEASVREGKRGADQGIARLKHAEDIFAQLWGSSEMNQEAADKLLVASDEAGVISENIRSGFDKLTRQLHNQI